MIKLWHNIDEELPEVPITCLVISKDLEARICFYNKGLNKWFNLDQITWQLTNDEVDFEIYKWLMFYQLMDYDLGICRGEFD